MSIAVSQVSAQDLGQLSELFRVLADRTRLQILWSLTEGEKNVSAICRELDLPQPTVSHHLALLRMNNIVGHHRDGKQVVYGLDGRVSVEGDSTLVLAVQNLIVRIEPRDK